MSSINKGMSHSNHHHHHNNDPFKKFGKTVQKTATDPNTYIGAGVAAAIAIPVTCAVQKNIWLSAAEKFDSLSLM